MSARIALTGFKREGTGKGTARALRREGKVPAVIYGDQKAPVTISLDENEIKKEYFKGHFMTSLSEVKIDGDTHLVLARDVQTHPVKDNVEHVDFLRVTSKTRIPVNIQVHFINEETCPGLKAGGILSVARYEVEVLCSALAIPDSIEIDLAEVQLNDSIKSSVIKLPQGVEFTINDREFTIASIVEPKAAVIEDEDEATAEGDAAEGEESTAEGGEGAAEGEDSE